ncbi:c-type cytochrome [Deinococcus fonticola]|uniref:c-type cytochrome n=1 Tax=Deinococcus fonticola TaxID=2528713 RepID=UPI001F0D4876|nr:c-type cytochrome [Deinococcus fonticola]
MPTRQRVQWLALFPLPLLLSACMYMSGPATMQGHSSMQASTMQAQGSPSAAPPPTAPAAGGNPLALKFGPPDAARGKALHEGACQQCHGAGGVSTKADVPGLAGQITPYLHLQLAAFRAKLRPSAVMQGVAARLSDQDIADLAAYYTPLQPGPAWKADADARARGEKLFLSGDAGRNVVACQVCHGADGRGVSDNEVASVTNLSPGYGLNILHEFRDAPSFGGIVAPEAMRIVLKPLSDGDLKDLAAYLSSMR